MADASLGETRTRPAESVDLEFLVNAFMRAGREMITASRGFWGETRERQQFERQLHLSCTRIIQNKDTDVGFVTAVMRGKDVELHTICVLPEYQNRGIGSWVTNEVIRTAIESGRGIVLSVLKGNKNARLFYERLGFAVVGSSEHHHRMRFREPSDDWDWTK